MGIREHLVISDAHFDAADLLPFLVIDV